MMQHADVSAQDGAFDEAVKGVDNRNTTSLCHLHPNSDPNDLAGPAVAGTLGLPRSVIEHSTTVKHSTTIKHIGETSQDLNEQTYEM